MTDLIKFRGNCPKNASRDAKYAIRTEAGEPVVALIYRTSEDEQWLATSRKHPELVEMVNVVKIAAGRGQNGPFYINEYSQVIVPVDDGEYYLAGEYDGILEFEFEGLIISGAGLGRSADTTEIDGHHPAASPPQPGEEWFGPHVGIPYTLKAGGNDISFATTPRPHVTKTILLSDAIGKDAAAALAKRIKSVKGWTGGRFYINEWREMFAPVSSGGDPSYTYIGTLELSDPWFPKPHA